MAHQQQPQHSPEALTLGRIQPREPAIGVELLSEAIGADGAIDVRHSAYGDNLSPPLQWTRVAGAGGSSAAPRYGLVPTVMAQPPSGGYGSELF